METDESEMNKDGARKFQGEGSGPGVYITLLIHASTSSGLPGPRAWEGEGGRLRAGADLEGSSLVLSSRAPATPVCLSFLSTIHPPCPGSRIQDEFQRRTMTIGMETDSAKPAAALPAVITPETRRIRRFAI